MWKYINTFYNKENNKTTHFKLSKNQVRFSIQQTHQKILDALPQHHCKTVIVKIQIMPLVLRNQKTKINS